jgi:hypothetical protein
MYLQALGGLRDAFNYTKRLFGGYGFLIADAKYFVTCGREIYLARSMR